MNKILYTALVLCILACNKNEPAQVKTPPAQVKDFLDTLPELQKIVAQIASDSNVEGPFVGYSKTPSVQYDAYTKLRLQATMDQLILLTKHPSPPVRCYAFQALAFYKSDKIFEILLQHLQDTTQVPSRSGCVTHNIPVDQYFLSVVTDSIIEPKGYKLKPSERRIIDSLLGNKTSPHPSSKSPISSIHTN